MSGIFNEQLTFKQENGPDVRLVSSATNITPSTKPSTATQLSTTWKRLCTATRKPSTAASFQPAYR
jgi:hypothetical protein